MYWRARLRLLLRDGRGGRVHRLRPNMKGQRARRVSSILFIKTHLGVVIFSRKDEKNERERKTHAGRERERDGAGTPYDAP